MSDLRPQENRPVAAILLMLATFLCFATLDTSAKWLVTHGFPAFQVAFVRYIVHFLVVLAIFAPSQGLSSLVRSRAVSKEILRAGFLLGSTVFNFFALRYLPITVTTAVQFASPLAVCALSIPLLGEKVGPRRWFAIGLGFVGVLIITQPWSAEFNWAILLSLGSMLCAALYFIMTRALAGIDHNMTMQFYASGLASAMLVAPAVPDWVWPTDTSMWLLFGALGVIGGAGHYIATTAHRLAPASTLAPIVYVQIIFVTFYSYVIFDTPPDEDTILGTLVIVVSGLYLWARERKVKGV
ncbi:DMT family transporter [Paroceanicella profunda]|uniref:DMT family transporter n=1 Tax=Paroceanicella profunda TaxID=2579971 RepID=A0A5B8FVP5_9RHOB|nr:DMT family transporter [Paroceanicella profunda]QDL91444.1 DMT family transporter [Paroceanicella profunda]